MQCVFGVLVEDWKKALIVIIFFSQLGNISSDYARMRVEVAKGENRRTLAAALATVLFIKERSQ
jgi:hypothetical protein